MRIAVFVFCFGVAAGALMLGVASAGPGHRRRAGARVAMCSPSITARSRQAPLSLSRQRHYVRAPFTEVDTRRGTWVAAPFARVYSGRRGTWVRAPFVNLWVPR